MPPSYPLTLPTTGQIQTAQGTFWAENLVQSITLQRDIHTRILAGGRWKGRFVVQPLKPHSQALRDWTVFLSQLRGSAGTFRMPAVYAVAGGRDDTHRGTVGTGGTPSAAVNRNSHSTSIRLQHYRPVVGDYLTFADQYLHLVEDVSDVNNQPTQVNVEIYPALYEDLVADETFEYEDPFCEARAINITPPTFNTIKQTFDGLTVEWQSIRSLAVVGVAPMPSADVPPGTSGSGRRRIPLPLGPFARRAGIFEYMMYGVRYIMDRQPPRRPGS